jgi:hypothetical protein
LYSPLIEPVESGCTQCNNTARSGATLKLLGDYDIRKVPQDEVRKIGLQAAGQMLIIPDLVLMQEPQHLCSNRAATRVNILKCWEKLHRPKICICRGFARPRNLQQTVVPPSHGGGQGFESPRVHLLFVAICRLNAMIERRRRYALELWCSNAACTETRTRLLHWPPSRASIVAFALLSSRLP